MIALRRALAVSVLAALFTVSALVTRAESGEEPLSRGTVSYAVNWSTISNGGAIHLEGDVYRLGSTIGQPVAGLAPGADFEIHAGFWSVSSQSGTLFADGFESGNTARWQSDSE